ncbi:MAG: hypothetical protein U7126_26350 [Microcoleus sp.]
MGNLGAFLGVPLFSDDLTDVVEEGFPNCIGDHSLGIGASDRA